MELLQAVFSMPFLAQPSLIASILTIVMLFIYWSGTRGFANLKKLNVPGPKPLPFLGNMLELKKYGALHLLHLDYLKKYGKVFTVSLGGKPSLVVGDPELLKQIMVKDFPHFRNRFAIQKPDGVFGKNVFIAREDDWKRIRNTLTPTFTAGKMKLMLPLIEKSCDTLMKKLEGVCDTDQSVDMLDWFSKLTLEVILSTAFGVDAKIQNGENQKMLSDARKIFKIPQTLRQIARLPFGNFVLRTIAKITGTSPNNLAKVAKEIIQSRREQGLTDRKDLLQLMMAANDETTAEGVSKLSDEEIVAQSVIFLLAGYETSSNTLSFTLYYLAVNPDVQDKLRSEIQEALEVNAGKKTMYEIASDIEYLDCVIKESQRLDPPAAMVNRECHEDYHLNGMCIPAGTEVVIPIYALHHDPDAWDEPEKFDPERFRGSAKDTRHAFQFLPFGAGPRNCIGMRFALLEIKIALVRILSKYKFVQSPETQVPLIVHAGATLTARDGVVVRVESVNQ